MAVVSLTKDNFNSEVLESSGTVFVDFWAPWCGPCRMTSPFVDAAAEERTDVKFCKVNVDEEPDVANMFNVMSIPTLMVFKDGKSVKREMGAKDKEGILAMLA